jgi:hypothetical protein
MCANADSLCSRSGLSPTAASSAPAVSTPFDLHQLWCHLVGKLLDLGVEGAGFLAASCRYRIARKLGDAPSQQERNRHRAHREDRQCLQDRAEDI